MNRVFVGFVLAVFLGALAVPTLAQQGTADIGGRVTDEQGGLLPGAMIVLTNEETGVFREVTSGEDGSYFVSALTVHPEKPISTDCGENETANPSWDMSFVFGLKTQEFSVHVCRRHPVLCV